MIPSLGLFWVSPSVQGTIIAATIILTPKYKEKWDSVHEGFGRMILFFSYFCHVFISQVHLMVVVTRRVFIKYIINKHYHAQNPSMWEVLFPYYIYLCIWNEVILHCQIPNNCYFQTKVWLSSLNTGSLSLPLVNTKLPQTQNCSAPQVLPFS